MFLMREGRNALLVRLVNVTIAAVAGRPLGGCTPSGAAVQSLSPTWAGGMPQASGLPAIVACALIALSLTTCRFRCDWLPGR